MSPVLKARLSVGPGPCKKRVEEMTHSVLTNDHRFMRLSLRRQHILWRFDSRGRCSTPEN